MSAPAAAEATQRIPLHQLHVSLGAKMVPFAGFEMPVSYAGLIQEHLAVRQSVGVFDVSHMGEFLVQGPGALPLLQHVTTNDVSALHDGKVQYSCMTNETGGIIDDLLVYRRAEDDYYVVVNASNIEKDWQWLHRHNHFGARLTNLSDQTCLFAVQGPNGVATVQKLTDLPLGSMDYYTHQTGTVAGLPGVMLATTGYTGAGGVEVYVANQHAETLWKAIFEAGAEFGIVPVGLGARDTLRTEMGYCLYGNDIDDTTSPIEAGLGWITKFNKDFVYSDFHRTLRENGVSRKLVGFEVLERGIPRQHYEIMDAAGHIIGEVTSGTQSPTLGRGIGMGYVQTEFSRPGSEIYIHIRGRYLKALVTKLPFLKK